MKFSITADLSLNVVFPLLCGGFLYAAGNSYELPLLIKNYLADGLWAYAFISSILIIWNRDINPAWLIVSFVIAAHFELLQHWHIVAGTGDVYDVLTYWLFFAISIQLNKFFKPIIKL